jgi:hypothetical protein
VTSNTRSRSRARSWAWPDKGYYRWLTDGPSEHDRTDEQLTDQIRKIHAELHGHPGVCRIWAELVVRGVRIGRKRVWRLMRAPVCEDAIHVPGNAPPSQVNALSMLLT